MPGNKELDNHREKGKSLPSGSGNESKPNGMGSQQRRDAILALPENADSLSVREVLENTSMAVGSGKKRKRVNATIERIERAYPGDLQDTLVKKAKSYFKPKERQVSTREAKHDQYIRRRERRARLEAERISGILGTLSGDLRSEEIEAAIGLTRYKASTARYEINSYCKRAQVSDGASFLDKARAYYSSLASGGDHAEMGRKSPEEGTSKGMATIVFEAPLDEGGK